MKTGMLVLLLLWSVNPINAFVGQGRNAPRARLPMARMSSQGRSLIQMMAANVPYKVNVESLLKNNRARIDSLAQVSPDVPELTLLRFALAFPNRDEAASALSEALAWRQGEGRSIVDAATEAVAKAVAGGGWDNEVVRLAAPHASTINQYISPKNILTLATAEGDLVYVIRASLIKDKELMSKVTVQQMANFFAYVKEVHSIVADARSERTGRLCSVIFANDITGVRAIPDPKFSEALTSSSKQYEKLYPSLAGPTMIVNLPFVLQAFVGLIKPLFPKTVQDRLKFRSAPFLAGLKELTPLTTSDKTRDSFLAEVKRIESM